MIISGAGEGAERGALRAAIDLELDCGGWYLAADNVPEIYRARMREAPTRAMQRRLNVQDSDATLFIVREVEMKFVVDACRSMRRPAKTLILRATDEISSKHAEALRTWLLDRKIDTLNVVGDEDEQVVRDVLVTILEPWVAHRQLLAGSVLASQHEKQSEWWNGVTENYRQFRAQAAAEFVREAEQQADDERALDRFADDGGRMFE